MVSTGFADDVYACHNPHGTELVPPPKKLFCPLGSQLPTCLSLPRTTQKDPSAWTDSPNVAAEPRQGMNVAVLTSFLPVDQAHMRGHALSPSHPY